MPGVRLPGIQWFLSSANCKPIGIRPNRNIRTMREASVGCCGRPEGQGLFSWGTGSLDHTAWPRGICVPALSAQAPGVPVSPQAKFCGTHIPTVPGSLSLGLGGGQQGELCKRLGSGAGGAAGVGGATMGSSGQLARSQCEAPHTVPNNMLWLPVTRVSGLC